MTNEQRIENYTRNLRHKRVDGFARLTPRQRRRAEKKFRRERKNSA